MKRYPDGVDGKFFYEKHVPSHAPDWVRTVNVPTGDNGEEVEYALVCDLPTLVWAANLGTIEFHVPLWRVGRRRNLPAPPDFIVFDLDPGEGSTLVQCCEVALGIEEMLRDRGLDPRVKTSGSKGLQVYAALGGRPSWEKSRADAHDVATTLEQRAPRAGHLEHEKDPAARQGAHRLVPEPSGQDDGRGLLRPGTAPPDGVDPGDVGGGPELREVRRPFDIGVHHL